MKCNICPARLSGAGRRGRKPSKCASGGPGSQSRPRTEPPAAGADQRALLSWAIDRARTAGPDRRARTAGPEPPGPRSTGPASRGRGRGFCARWTTSRPIREVCALALR